MAAVMINLECLTNMHVGNGDVNFNIIDNEVERDVVTGYPTINASGVKGALREYFVKKQIEAAEIDDIFGGSGVGKLRFLGADMIAMPARASVGSAAYYLISTKEAVAKYEEKCSLFLKKKVEFAKKAFSEERQVEGFELKEMVGIFDKDVYLLDDATFRKISLPVLARNKLDNGKSVNLWYEEVVPHKSLFSFVVLAEDSDKALLDRFVAVVQNQIVQFGGNASIGYGLCKVSVMEG